MAARDASDATGAAGTASARSMKSRTKFERVSDREIVVERTFNGPARIVFDAWTKPELVRQWWAPTSMGASMVSVDADVRVGGRYRYVVGHGSKGAQFAFSGAYTEIAPPSRLVYTSFFEPEANGILPGVDAVIVTVTFEERDGRTHLVSSEVYPSKEVLDMAVGSGMEAGVHITMDQLDILVASLEPDSATATSGR
jgi:uncharacterized protein YndB with AHSA1/START domain